MKASGHLFDLGLDVRKLPKDANKKFFREASALYRSTNGRFHPKLLAVRFFGWYVVEFPHTDVGAYTKGGSASGSLPIMREWSVSEPELKSMVEKEVQKVGTYLYQAFEDANISDEDRINAQLALLEMMGAKND